MNRCASLGNCEIAELVMRSAEKIGIRLDQVTNREGKIFVINRALFVTDRFTQVVLLLFLL